MGWQDAPLLDQPPLPAAPKWAEAPLVAAATPPDAVGFIENVQAGLQGSAIGLAMRGKLPDLVMNPQSAAWWERLAAGVSGVAADLPIMIPAGAMGAAAGTATPAGPVGGILAGGAAMFAAPAGIRTSLTQFYKARGGETPIDWFNIVRETAKSMLHEGAIGAATFGAGAVARGGAAALMGASGQAATAVGLGTATMATKGAAKVAGTADVAAQIAGMVTAPWALGGPLPELREFGDAAAVILTLKGAHVALEHAGALKTTAQRVMGVYEKTGKTPAEQVQDAMGKPDVAEDLTRPDEPIPTFREQLTKQEELWTIQDRLSALVESRAGKPEQKTVDDYGNEVVIPAKQPELFTYAEKQEYDALKAKATALEAEGVAPEVPRGALPPGPRYAPDQLESVKETAARRIAELTTKEGTGPLTDIERAERIGLVNALNNPEALAKRYGIEPAIKPITDADRQASAQRVYDDVLRQAKENNAAREAAGLEALGDEHALAVATLMRSRLLARATRLGVLPEDLYNERPLQIRDATQAESKAEIDAAPPDLPTFAPPATAEVDLFGNPVAPPIALRHSTEGKPIENIPVNGLTLSKDVPQFKHDADVKGVVEPLGGEPDPTGWAIQVWERLNGAMEVISGRHRLELWQRHGLENIPAQIHRESEGFTARDAAMLDAELNIRDQQGSVADYVQYFKDRGYTREQADERGLLARSKGQMAFAIARDGTPALIAANRAYRSASGTGLSPEAAFSISQAAPGSERMQNLGIALVNDGKSALFAVNMMKAVDLLASEAQAAGKQGDLWNLDDSGRTEAAAMSKKAASRQRQISEQISAVQGAARRPEMARKLGVNVEDPEGIQKKIAELKQEQYQWDNWPLYPELVAKLRGQELHQDERPKYELTAEGPALRTIALHIANTDFIERRADVDVHHHFITAPDGTPLGEMALGWKGREVVELVNIMATPDRHGTGEAVIRAILANNKPDTELLVANIQPEARQFWEKMGTELVDNEGVTNGYITRERYDAAAAKRADAIGNKADTGTGGPTEGNDVGGGAGPPEGGTLYQGRRQPVDDFELKPETPAELKARDEEAAAAAKRKLAQERAGVKGPVPTVDQADLFNTQRTLFQSEKDKPWYYSELARLRDLTAKAESPAAANKVNAPVNERSTNRVESDVQFLGDLVDAGAGTVEGLRALDAPRQRMVLSAVLDLIHDGEIGKRIISTIPVDVMNELRAQKFSTETSLDHESMLGKGNTINIDANIISASDALLKFMSEVAGLAAEGNLAFALRGKPEKLASALETGQSDGRISVRHGVTPESSVVTGEGGVQAPLSPNNITRIDRLFQSRDQERSGQHLGSYSIAENLIQTFRNANKSTIVHELSHSWLEEMKADAARPDAPAQIKADWELIRREFAIGADGDISTASHEQFARTGERYLGEGVAPSIGLRAVFERFKAWMLEIYANLQNLGVEINPEVRGMFDRMLATDQEIADAKAMDVPRAYVSEARAEIADRIVPPAPEGRKIEPGFAAEQASMQPYADELPKGPGEAPDSSHVNYAYINSPMDVKLAMQRMAEIDQANIQKQRGGTAGVKSWEEANAEQAKYVNDILGGSEDTLRLLSPRDPGAAGPDVKLGILKKLAVGAAKDSARLRDIVLEAGHDATVRQQLEYMGSIERARMIQAEFLGERAGVARALNALKDVTEGTGEIGRMLDAIGYGEAAARELFQTARTPAEEQAYMRAKLDEILQNYRGKTVLDIAKLHKEIGTLKGTFKMAKDLEKATTWEMVVEGWKAGLLSGPVTHTTNLFGTGAFQVLRAPVDALAAIIGVARGASPGMGESDRASMSESVARLTGYLGGIQDGIKVGYHTFMADQATPKTESYREAIPGRAGEIIRIPLRLMSAEDAMVTTMYTRGELRTLAIRQAFDEQLNPATREFATRVDYLMDHPTPEIQAKAETAATRMTFNAPLGEKGVALQLFVNKWNLQWMIPFIRTPINIAKELLRMSPFAPAVGEWRAAIRQGGVERDRALAEIALGTGITALTMAYAFAGNISGAGSPDPGKNRGKAGVWQPYSILIGDTWYEYARIQPTGTLMGMAADIASIWDHMTEEEKDKVPKMLAAAFAQAITNQTFLQGITNVVNAMSDPARFGPRFLQQMAGSMVPNVIGQPTTMADPVVREVNGMLEAIQARIPGMRQDLLPKRDWLGEPVETKERVGVVLPSRTQKVSEDKVRLEAARLDISMAAAPKKTHIGKGTGKLGDVKLTPEERNTFAKVGGEMAHKILDNIVNAPGYDQMPDLVKRKVFAKVLQASHQVAAVAALPMDKRIAYIQSISEKMTTELAPEAQ